MAYLRWIVLSLVVVSVWYPIVVADSTPAPLCPLSPSLDQAPTVNLDVFGPDPGASQITCNVTASGRLCTATCDCGNGNSVSCSGPASDGCSVDDSDGTVTCGGDDKGSCTTPA